MDAALDRKNGCGAETLGFTPTIMNSARLRNDESIAGVDPLDQPPKLPPRCTTGTAIASRSSTGLLRRRCSQEILSGCPRSKRLLFDFFGLALQASFRLGRDYFGLGGRLFHRWFAGFRN